ncbi:MAG: hypothetical protein ACRDK7_08710 [Solirubrobacteraceae bacterium]
MNVTVPAGGALAAAVDDEPVDEADEDEDEEDPQPASKPNAENAAPA